MSQYNDNPYYSSAGGGGGGGGFIAGGSPFGSASGSPGGSARQRTEASQSLRAVTVGQLLKASQIHAEAEYIIDDQEIGHVTLVASVVSIQNQATNTVYWLDDGTGRIEARHWLDASSEEDQQKWAGIEENIYVRVTGGLKTFVNKRYINVVRMRPTKDAHELYFHLLEAMTTNLIFERGPPTGAGAPAQGSSAYTTNSVAAQDKFTDLPPLQRSIMQFMIKQPPNDEGIHVGAIARAVGGEAHLISEALDALMDSGAVYSTMDESHFQIS